MGCDGSVLCSDLCRIRIEAPSGHICNGNALACSKFFSAVLGLADPGLATKSDEIIEWLDVFRKRWGLKVKFYLMVFHLTRRYKHFPIKM